MINKVILIGRLTKDPVLKHTSNNISVTQFTLAVDRQFKNSQGERGVDFVSCVIWKKSAENFVNFEKKGNLTAIDGRIQTRTYDGNGKKVYVTEVVVENFTLLEKKQDNGSNNSTYTSSTKLSNNFESNNQNNNDFGNENTTSNNALNTSSSMKASNNNFDMNYTEDSLSISDDDLPF